MARIDYIAPAKNSIAHILATITDVTVAKNSPVTAAVTDEPSVELCVKRTHADYTNKAGEWTDEIAGSLSTEMSQWTKAAVQDIIQMIEMTSPLDHALFTVSRKLSNNGITIDTGSVSGAYLTDGSGASFQARKGEKFLAHKYQDANSIHYASNIDPVWFLDDGKFYIYPFDGSHSAYVTTYDYPRHGAYWTGDEDTLHWTTADYINRVHYSEYDEQDIPKVANKVKYRSLSAIDGYVVMEDTLTSILPNSSVSEPEPTYERRVPEKYNKAIAIYIAMELYKYRLRVMYDKLPPSVDYSGTLSTPAEGSHGWEKVRWYVDEDEDTELAQLKMAELNAEQQAWMVQFQWYKEQLGNLSKEYQQFFNVETQKKDRGL
jgi:hypothetical protein